jgi:hypothetical protein
LLPALLVAGDASRAVSQTADLAPWRFAVGESLEYVVGLGAIRAGRGLLAVEAYETYRGVPAYRVSLRIEASVPFVQFEDHLTSWIATDPVRSLGIEKVIHEGDKRSRHRYELDYERGAYRAEEWDDRSASYVPMNGSPGSEAIPDPALDEVAFLYLMRLLALEPGARYEFGSHFQPAGNPVVFRVIGKEKVRVPAGRFNTVVVDPVLPAMGILRRDAGARVYLSDDDRRLIVKLTTSTRFGTIALHLREYTEGTGAVADASTP